MFFKIFAAGIALIAVIALITILSIYIPRWTAEPIGKTEEVVITNKGAYRIQAYERFYIINEEIQALDNKLSTVYTVNSGSSLLNPRQQTECNGLLFQRSNLVGEYNSRARAILTTGKWQANDLPFTMPQLDNREGYCKLLM